MTQAMFRILVVEDDRHIREVVHTLLEAANYRVVLTETAARAVIEARAHKPDAVIVDLGLPDRDGQAVIRELRQFSTVPIIVLSARTGETDKVMALDGGADDYVTKPFSASELLARVRAGLRRGVRSADQPVTFQIGDIVVNLGTRDARGPAGTVHFTPVEYRLLASLASSHGLVVTQGQLISAVWGPNREGDTSGLRSYVRLLRQKLEPDPTRPRFLLTEPGVGYRLVLDQ
jgi:two-component system KDP operon response regulator KdpE